MVDLIYKYNNEAGVSITKEEIMKYIRDLPKKYKKIEKILYDETQNKGLLCVVDKDKPDVPTLDNIWSISELKHMVNDIDLLGGGFIKYYRFTKL